MTNPIRRSWPTQPLPSERQHFTFFRSFSADKAERLVSGYIPKGMDDRWFVLFENGWLYFYRSWTGFCVFGLKMEPTIDGLQVIDAWASADTEQYRSLGVEQDRRMLDEMIDWLLNP